VPARSIGTFRFSGESSTFWRSSPISTLKAHPDVKPALRSLKAAGFQLVFLSNMTPAMLETGLQNSDLKDLFAESLSTDRLHT
jgi:2-haloacid dehalogenase